MWNRHGSYCGVGKRFGVMAQTCLIYVTSSKTVAPLNFSFLVCERYLAQ